jgi:hypothetical protein
MVDEAIEKEKTRIERFMFSVRLRGIFFPLGFSEISQIADKTGFTLTASLREKPAIPSSARLMVTGRIAEKGDLSFNVDPNRGIITVEGNIIEDVLREFNAIEDLARQEFGLDFTQEGQFYEAIADLSIVVYKNPVETVSKLFSGSKILSDFSTILHEEVGNYGVRLVKKGQEPNGEEWFEYRVEPLVAKPRNVYYSNVIYRSKVKDNVVKAATELVEKIQQLIFTMEKL